MDYVVENMSCSIHFILKFSIFSMSKRYVLAFEPFNLLHCVIGVAFFMRVLNELRLGGRDFGRRIHKGHEAAGAQVGWRL